MKNIDTSNTELLFTFHDIYSDAPDYDIFAEIEQVDVEVGISVICELLQSLNYKVDVEGLPFCFPFETALKKEFFGINPSSFKEFNSCEFLHKDKHIISQQMLLILLKHFLIYGKKLPEKKNVVDKDTYRKIINLCLMITEECNQHIMDPTFDANNFIYCNYHVSSSKNIAAAFVRTYYMLEIINPQKELFSDVEREYVNYKKDYLDKYGFGIIETLSVLFWETNAYIGTECNRLAYAPIWKSIDDVYGNTPLFQIAQGVIGMLSLDFSSREEWAKESIDRMWDFTEFLSKPFIIDGRKRYLSISEYTLKNAFFENVFWLIRDCYPQENKSAMAFYGRLFEKYIQKLSEEATSNNKEVSYIDEFTFGKDNKRSSDAYIRSEKKLLVVEAKGFSILISSLMDEDIEKNNNKLFVKPILEANECFFNIRASKDNRFDDIEEIYIVSVTMDSINAVPQYLEDILGSIHEAKKDNGISEFYYNLNIDEYEMLMRQIELGEDIFAILHDYDSLPNMIPFSNYLRKRSSTPISMTDYMRTVYEGAANEMKRLYGVGE